MLGNQKTVAFLATANAASARTFYESTLGLRVIHEDDFALVFSLPHSQLRIQKVDSVQPHPHTAFGWSVTSIDSTVRQISAAGVVFQHFEGLSQNEAGIWNSPSGARIAWFRDPDGNLLSLTEYQPDRD